MERARPRIVGVGDVPRDVPDAVAGYVPARPCCRGDSGLARPLVDPLAQGV